MKKTIIITVIVMFLLNLIYVPSFAAADVNGNLDPSQPISTEPQENGLIEITNDKGSKTKTGITGSSYSGPQIIKVLAVIATAIPRAANSLFGAFVDQTSTNPNSTSSEFTIYDMVMGNYEIFNIDFTGGVPKEDSMMKSIKQDVYKFYVLTRNFSIAISLFVLIYMGIRMAISTVATEQAKYKKMLINWVASLMILFLLHIIIVFISFILQIGLGLLTEIAKIWKLEGFEAEIFANAVTNLSSHGFNVFASVVIIWVITWYQTKFFFYYLHRTLEVHFMVIVAPLVTITYPIDKAGDGKAQAFGNLIKEVIIKCSMQLIHSLIYIVFIGTAGVIAISQPLVAIVFFIALARAEKITRKIFGVDDEGFEKTTVPFVEG